jgi:hypothetical protein
MGNFLRKLASTVHIVTTLALARTFGRYEVSVHGVPLWQLTSVDLKNRKGGDPMEWPEDLRVRQMPEAA